MAAAAALLVLAACEPPQVVIPDGATNVVHVHLDAETVRLDPATVRAGDVFFVIEGPGPAFSLVRWLGAPDAEPRGLTPAEITRLRDGDYVWTQLDSYNVRCDPNAWTEERHWQGCRENAMVPLLPGMYAIVAGSGDGGVAPIMAVLEVEP